MGSPMVSPKQGIAAGNVRALDDTMRTSVAGRTGLVFYALIAGLLFIGLLVIWPLWGPLATAGWIVLWGIVGAGILFYTRHHRV